MIGKKGSGLPCVLVCDGMGGSSPELDARNSGWFLIVEADKARGLVPKGFWPGVAIAACALR